MPAEELGPLPAGRHGYSREQVAHHQRERLIAGLAAAVAEKGYAAVTLDRHHQASAKVSRRVFYANFESKEECFLAAFEVVVSHLRELVAEAVAASRGLAAAGDRRHSRRARLPRRRARPRPPLPGRVARRRPGGDRTLQRGGGGDGATARAGARRARRGRARASPTRPRTRRSAPSSRSLHRKVAAGEATQLRGPPPRVRRIRPRALSWPRRGCPPRLLMLPSHTSPPGL